MRIKKFFRRFEERRAVFIGSDISWFTKIWYYIDYLFALIYYGASINDYFAYGFYKLRHSGRNEYITYRRYHKIMNICNSQSVIDICRSKLKFNQYFSDYIGREWIDLNTSSVDEFILFTKKHNSFFVKDILGYRGIGIKRYESKDIVDLKKFYNGLLYEKQSYFIIEQPIYQNEELKEFHPWSVNTIRITTLFDTTNNIVHFMNALIRMGNKRNSVDNFHFEGIAASIDIETGIVKTVGYDSNNKTYLTHPETGKQIIGFHIPYWDDCKTFIEKSARRLPAVRYVGWDLVIKSDNTFCLIEANDNADHDFQQMYNKGLWQQYKQILKQIK